MSPQFSLTMSDYTRSVYYMSNERLLETVPEHIRTINDRYKSDKYVFGSYKNYLIVFKRKKKQYNY